ncbi:phosphatidylinositol 4-phosphate 3-kinase C2 domain-containing subunit beta isoform X2 [Planococcus citri]|uniref:phosphatidylinositol 4-phosphate 3-kinase C2 domain-containing subunit beta isoform X2 n=1 Tax=Planococcus citri TaxID=170843 RepID=UPI0031F9527A
MVNFPFRRILFTCPFVYLILFITSVFRKLIALWNAMDEREEEASSECSNSLYAVFDPFDYMYSPSECSQHSDPIYAAVVKTQTPLNSPPPLPPRNHSTPATELSAQNSPVKKYQRENITVRKRNRSIQDPDLIAFHRLVKTIRNEFKYNDAEKNMGIVISPRIECTRVQNLSIKIIMHCEFTRPNPVIFTCDADSTVEQVILQTLCDLSNNDSAENYIVKVRGLAEYLLPNTNLSSYVHILQCIKLDEDVELTLLPSNSVSRKLARTAQDDTCDSEIKIEDLIPNEFSPLISYESLSIVLETLEKEMNKIEISVGNIFSSGFSFSSIQTRGVQQALKAICSLLGNMEPSDISKSLIDFIEICNEMSSYSSKTDGNSWMKPRIIDDEGEYSIVNVPKAPPARETIANHCEKIKESVYKFIDTYCHTFDVDFELSSPSYEFTGTKYSREVGDPVLVYIDGLHRLGNNWNYDEYLIVAQVYHGTRPVGEAKVSKSMQASGSFFKRLIFDCWLSFDNIGICLLPRESRLVFVVYGRSINLNAEQSSSQDNQSTDTELGWTSIQFFNYDGILSQGSYLLMLSPSSADRRLGPSPPLGYQLGNQSQPILNVEFPCYSSHVKFPHIAKDIHTVSKDMYDFNSLDRNTQEQLLQMVEQDVFNRPPTEDREVLWEKRHYLLSKPQALPKVFLAAYSWDSACLPDLHSMLHSWSPLQSIDALQLLLPCFPDIEVRKKAVSWMESFSHDEVVDYLPQLIQALKHETYETSALAEFLLRRSLLSPRVAHYLYWLLIQLLPTQLFQNPNNYDLTNLDEKAMGNARYFRRILLMYRVLIMICGQAVRHSFNAQQLLVKTLYEVAENIKSTKESLRIKTLLQDLESVHDNLQENVACLPLKPSLEVNGIQVKTCSYFPSNTLPLKISFQTVEKNIIPAIFKAGDDLQQDMLTIQMIKIMDKWWLKEGLDLKIVTFACISTGDKRGIIEMVTEAETLRKIQIELGLTGSFKETPIDEWLRKHNPSALEYERAVQNFTASCAGYSVATYILGICDRHNDNIMLKRSGHLFHIDFGKFLGDAQTFGSFKRDRTPFVLTPDMAYVINGSDKSTEKFHHFVDLCCQAFNIIRKHGNLLLYLFGLMISSGIPGVTMDAVTYVQKSLLLDLTNAEAAATFARMIESSLKSWFTQFNFFLHNLAQLRFTGDHNDAELLSFVPKRYTMNQEGRIQSVEVYGYQKRYDPEKYYVYILKVKRENQPEPSYLFRSYKEFCELHQKICLLFPLAKCHSLHSSSLLVGRSNIKQVAEKRKYEIEKFLNMLFQMADEISHSDVVYTFFHPLLRDQQEANINQEKLKERKSKTSQTYSKCVRGELKLTLNYQRGALIVMVNHAKELPRMANNQEPSTYVKVYLLPDPMKMTKRKTKVIKRSCHPSFMEMLEYRMPLDVLQFRVLQATVWNHDTLQENEFLGAVSLPLHNLVPETETTDWYPLGNVCR